MELLFDLPLAKEDNLLKKFEEIHNYLYANDGLSTQQTLEEIVKILFIKIFDENNRTGLFHLSADEWSNLKQAKQAWPFIERIAQLFDTTKQAYRDVFDEDDKIRLSPISFTAQALLSRMCRTLTWRICW